MPWYWPFGKRDVNDSNEAYTLKKIMDLIKPVKQILNTNIRMNRAAAISKLKKAYAILTIPDNPKYVDKNELLADDIKELLDLLARYESKHADYMEKEDFVGAQRKVDRILDKVKYYLRAI